MSHLVQRNRLDLRRIIEQSWITEVEYYATIGSTNDRAKQCAMPGATGLPKLIVADEQTAGRGRGTNRWWTGAGNLAFSLLLEAPQSKIPRTRSPLVALAAAVAVAEAAAPLLPASPPVVKWPNDVCWGDRKLAGVLVEVPSNAFLVVGVGVNVNSALDQAPAELRHTLTTLWELTRRLHDPTAILLTVLNGLAPLLEQLAVEPEAVAARADSLCVQRGQEVIVDTGRRRIVGRCAGIAPDGALLVETGNVFRRIYSGVVRNRLP